MKRVRLLFIIFFFFLVAGCAGLPITKSAPVAKKLNVKLLKIVIPNIVNGHEYIDIKPMHTIWGVRYYRGSISQRQLLIIKNITKNTFTVERRSDNGISGSGIIYTVQFNIKKGPKNTYVTYKPLRFKTYQEGILLPFPVPSFSEQDLINFLKSRRVYYKMEFDSKYNSESIFANFDRLAEKVNYKAGERDPVTGKIFKNRFAILYKNQRIYFSLEIYPYRNGSKTIVYLTIPGIYTSNNLINFDILLKAAKTRIAEIVNS